MRFINKLKFKIFAKLREFLETVGSTQLFRSKSSDTQTLENRSIKVFGITQRTIIFRHYLRQ